MQVGRNGQDAGGIQDVGESERVVIPAELDEVGIAVRLLFLRGERDKLILHEDWFGQYAALPLLEIAHHAGPATTTGLLEDLRVVAGNHRL